LGHNKIRKNGGKAITKDNMKRGIKNRLFTQAAAFPGLLSGFPFESSGRDISTRSLLKILKCWMKLGGS